MWRWEKIKNSPTFGGPSFHALSAFIFRRLLVEQICKFFILRLSEVNLITQRLCAVYFPLLP